MPTLSPTAPHIKCGNCGKKHWTAQQVKDCYYPPQDPKEWRSHPVTERQLSYIDKLGGDRNYASKMTKGPASDYIEMLKKGTAPVTQQPAPPKPPENNRYKTIVPLDMLLLVPDGRYAVRQDSNHPYVFFRVSRPKNGNFAGMFKVQTQHGEDYKLNMTVSLKTNKVYMYDKRWENDLLLVCVDWNGAGIAYGQELGRCSICGKELTDERSRWYGIGPDCETRHPHRIELVDASPKGPFTFGA
jgi:hypothetical protein